MEKNKFFQVLEHARETGLITSIYSNRSQPDTCSVGFIEEISDEQIVIKHITSNGLYDGYFIRRLNDIYRIDVNGQYEQRLLTLYKLQNQNHKDFLLGKVSKKDNLFKKALSAAQKLNQVVSVCIDETEEQDSLVGWVKDINNEEVTISQISFEGLDDGESLFYIDDIVKINCDSVDERAFGMLNLNHKGVMGT